LVETVNRQWTGSESANKKRGNAEGRQESDGGRGEFSPELPYERLSCRQSVQ
jgi:hypothetical protein